MRNIIILISIIFIIVLFNLNYEYFYQYKHTYNHTDQNLDKYKLLSKDDAIMREILKKPDDDEIIQKYKEYTDLKNYLIKTNLEQVKDKMSDIKTKFNKNKKELEILLYNKYKPNYNNYNEKNNEYYEQVHNFINNYIILNKFQNEEDDSEQISRCIQNFHGPCYNVFANNLYENNKHISLTRMIESSNTYVINLNNLLLNYLLTNTDEYNEQSQFKLNELNFDYSNREPFYFQLHKINNNNQLNNFIIDGESLQYSFVYPLYIIMPSGIDLVKFDKHLLTIRNNKLSLEPINNKNIRYQIFYISYEKICVL